MWLTGKNASGMWVNDCPGVDGKCADVPSYCKCWALDCATSAGLESRGPPEEACHTWVHGWHRVYSALTPPSLPETGDWKWWFSKSGASDWGGPWVVLDPSLSATRCGTDASDRLFIACPGSCTLLRNGCSAVISSLSEECTFLHRRKKKIPTKRPTTARTEIEIPAIVAGLKLEIIRYWRGRVSAYSQAKTCRIPCMDWLPVGYAHKGIIDVQTLAR